MYTPLIPQQDAAHEIMKAYSYDIPKQQITTSTVSPEYGFLLPFPSYLTYY